MGARVVMKTLGGAVRPERLILLVMMALPLLCRASANWPADPEARLDALRASAIAGNGHVRAAWAGLLEAEAGALGVAGYFDTVVATSAGVADWSRNVPGATSPYAIGSDRAVLQAGVEQPVQPGIFVAAGVSSSFLRQGDLHARDANRTLAGVQVRVPLLQNRGHAQWRWEQAAAEAGMEMRRARLRAVIEDMRLASDRTYIALLHAVADAAAFQRAAARVASLLEGTEALVRLQAVPAYQLFPSRADAALRADETVAAEQLVQALRQQLATLLDGGEAVPATAADLPRWAAQRLPWVLAMPATPGEEMAHGSLRALSAQRDEAQALLQAADDAARPDVQIVLQTTWESGDETRLAEGWRDAGMDDVGYEAALVWRSPLQRRQERAARAAARARVAAVEAQIAQQALSLTALRAEATGNLKAAARRMALVGEALDNARSTLEAEAERFRLGEGRSRDVLDAQKDLTTAELRRNATAAALLLAYADWSYAAGYPEGLVPGEAPSKELSLLLATLEEGD